MAMTSFYFKAVASDGKVRTGTSPAETTSWSRGSCASRDSLRSTWDWSPRRASSCKLPSFSAGQRRDVLFFTQELSTLLNAGVPLDRALSITSELTERPALPPRRAGRAARAEGRQVAGRQPGDAPANTSRDLYVNMVRAGEASGSLAVVFERLAEFERRATNCAATSSPRWSTRRC